MNLQSAETTDNQSDTQPEAGLKRPVEAQILLLLSVALVLLTPLILYSMWSGEYSDASTNTISQSTALAIPLCVAVNLFLAICIWKGHRWALIAYSLLLGALLPVSLFIVLIYVPVVILIIFLWARSKSYFK